MQKQAKKSWFDMIMNKTVTFKPLEAKKSGFALFG